MENHVPYMPQCYLPLGRGDIPNMLTGHDHSSHTHTFNGPFSRTTRVGRYQKGKTNLDFTEARETVSGSGISWAYASLHLAPDR